MNLNPVSSSAAAPHLEYYGGKTLANPVLVPMYIGAYWNSESGKGDRRYFDRFASYLGGSKFFSVLKQYGIERSKFGGSELVSSAKNPTLIDDRGIQKLVRAEIAAGRAGKPDSENLYVVYLPPGTVLNAPGGYSSRQGVGGYHSSFLLDDGSRAYYAAIVYADSGNGIAFTSSPRDNVTIAASHEIAEAATDPDVNQGTLGWYDEQYGEVADIPIEMGYSPSQVWGRLGRYAVQKQWSNEDDKSEISRSATKK